MIRSAHRTPETASVLIATFRRTRALQQCLSALEAQERQPDEVLIVVREGDVDTFSYLRDRPSSQLFLKIVQVSVPGAVAARNAGLDCCRSDIVAIIDDDTVPHIDWLQRLMLAYRNDSHLGGLGGRDRCFEKGKFDDHKSNTVGKITWYGRMIGNHHQGFGSIRDVDFLKGANMSFRREAVEAIRFDLRLHGSGAQPAEDTCFSIACRQSGWKLQYDPLALVDHYPAQRAEPRAYAGVAKLTDPAGYRDFCYNQVVAVWLALPPLRRAVFFIWSVLIGTGIFPGLVQALRFTPTLGTDSWRRLLISQSAKCRAFLDLMT